MIEIDCYIEGEKIVNGKQNFIVRSINDNSEYIIPKALLNDFGVKVGDKKIFYKIYDKIKKEYCIRLKNSTDNYPIIGFDKILTKKGQEINCFVVNDQQGNKIKVACFSWQRKETWNNNSLRCEIQKYSSTGIPILTNRDYHHPCYKINGIYDFNIVEKKNKTYNGKDYDFYELLGTDGCNYEVNMIPGQILYTISSSTIKCKVLEIYERVRLSQVNISDPYYFPVEEIIEDGHLIKKYFHSIFTEHTSVDITKEELKDQYNTKSAFWIFTFTNKILPVNFDDAIKRENYKEAEEINRLVILFEKWIISKGILRSMPDEKLRENTLLKAKSELALRKNIQVILAELITDTLGILDNRTLFSNPNKIFQNFYYVFKYCNIAVFDDRRIVFIVNELLNRRENQEQISKYELRNLLRLFTHKKRFYIDSKNDEYFKLNSSGNNISYDDVKNSQYLNYSYCELLITISLGEIEYGNILIGQMLRKWNNKLKELDVKLNLLFNSYYYFENYQNKNLANPFYFDGTLQFDFKKFIKNIPIEETNNADWEEIEASFKQDLNLNAKLTKKSESGYEVTYKSKKGFLPCQNISDGYLKHYSFEDCDFSTSVKCTAYSKLFNFFTVEQLPLENNSFFFINNNKFEIGSVYQGVIKSIQKYGCFISTKYGDGRLHPRQIFNFDWNYDDIKLFFKEKDEIKVIVDSILPDGKVEFNFSRLENIDFKYYKQFVDKIQERQSNINPFSEELESEFSNESNFDITQKEKAFCFELNAFLQNDILEKLHSFRLAKQFFAITKDARSFLINIYTDYFEVILKIQNCLNNKSLVGISEIKQNAVKVKENINARTIETFPDAEKLIYFLEIINLFNETRDDSLALLYKYIQQHSGKKKETSLKTIAKITMANNLMVSESQDNEEFCLKNLMLIFNYISNGILSLSETVQDKYEIELREEVLYWRGKIKGDESETLEFKSSFFTPIFDDSKRLLLNQLESLPNQTEDIKKNINKIKGESAKKAIIHSSLKTLAAFANTSGGVLLIGVRDDKTIIGLENEYLTFKTKDKNRDGFGKFFDDMVKVYLGESFSSLTTRKFIKFPEGDILIVSVKPSSQEIFLQKDEEGKDVQQLYIRALSSSRELVGNELAKFIKRKTIAQLNMSVV